MVRTFSSDAKATSMPTRKSGPEERKALGEMQQDASLSLLSRSAVKAFIA